MRMFMRIGIPVVLCLLVLGASQVMAEQCSICNRTIAIPTSYVAPSPSCGPTCGSCSACSVQVIKVMAAPCATPCATAPAPCATPCPHHCNQCASASSCNTCNSCNSCNSSNNCNSCNPCNNSSRAVWDQLRYENRQQKDLFAKIRCAPDCALPDLYCQFRANVVSHIKALQNTLYAQAANAQCCDPCTAHWIALSAEQQQMVLTQICALDQTAMCDPLWRIRFENLADIIARSWFIEQDKTYGAVAKCIPDECNSLCSAYNDAKSAALASLPPCQVLSTTAFVPGACFGSVNTSCSNNNGGNK